MNGLGLHGGSAIQFLQPLAPDDKRSHDKSKGYRKQAHGEG